MRIPTAAATTLSNCAFVAMWMLCNCAHARWPHSSESYCAKRPDASGFSSSGSLAILAAIRRAASRVSNLAAYSRFAMPLGTPPFDSAAPAPTASHSLARE